MKKSDLIPGKHIVETRNGCVYLVIADGGLSRNLGWENLRNYHSDLTHPIQAGWDIVRVFVAKERSTINQILALSNATVVWERDKKTEQQEQARAKLRELEHKQRQLAEEISKVREDLA